MQPVVILEFLDSRKRDRHSVQTKHWPEPSDLQRMQPQSILKAPGKNGDWSDRIYPHATNMSIDYHFSGALYG